MAIKALKHLHKTLWQKLVKKVELKVENFKRLHINALQQQQRCVSCFIFMAAPQGKDHNLRLKWGFLSFFFSPRHHMYASVGESAGRKIDAQQQVRKEAGLRYSFGFGCEKVYEP